jgi:hypothetical protein
MSLSLPAAAADLAQTAAAFTHWRTTTPVGARIPEELWSQAVALAVRHGVSQVATTLHLDYARLKRRLTALTAAPPLPPPATPPAFVDLVLGLPPSGPGCVLVVADAYGRSLRIEWTATAPSEVATVARSLWETAP